MLQLKSLIQEKLPDAEITISAPTLRSDNGKAALTVRQLTSHLLNLTIDILDNRNITGKHFKTKGSPFKSVWLQFTNEKHYL